MSTLSVDLVDAVSEKILTLPSEVFKTNSKKATKKLIMTLILIISGIMVVRAAPWFLLPFGWLLLGTAQTGLYAVGYSCGQNTFFGRSDVNYVIGTLCMLPLMYPFRYFQLISSKKKTSTTTSSPHFSDRVASTELWFLSSLAEWIMSVFEGERNRSMMVSASLLYLFAVVFFGILHYGLGLWGIFKFYLIPLGVFHFWMSAFMKAKNMSKDNDVYAQFPSWVDMMSNDYNYGMNVEMKAQPPLPIPPYTSRHAFCVMRDKLGPDGMHKMPLKSVFLPKKVAQAMESKTGMKYTITIKEDSRVMRAINTIVKGIKALWRGLKAFNWLAGPFLVLTPIGSIYGLFYCEWYWQTFVLCIVTTHIACLGVTLGYHRLYSHRAYDASHIYAITVLTMATSAFEMSCIQWANDHRAHHRYTDTEKDPYNIKKGFWYAHIGWLLWWRKRPSSDVSDLKAIWYVQWQHYLFVPSAFVLAWAIPWYIAGHFWGDWWGGFFIAGVLKSVLAHHATFCINSLAHMYGDHTYSDQRTPRDNIWTALITCGEGYHNFHHEFPYDYRNGINTFDYDPTKWVIYICSLVGLTYNLQRFSDETIAKGRLLMDSKRIEAERAKYFWGKPIEELPSMTIEEVTETTNTTTTTDRKKYMVIDGVVYDVTEFAEKHPGGENLITMYQGKDASSAFNGAVYNHSVAARNILATLRIARLVKSSSKDD